MSPWSTLLYERLLLKKLFIELLFLGKGYRSNMRLEQIVEPGSPRAFFESDPQSSAQSREELQDGCCLRFQDGFHDNLALGIHHRHGDRCLMNIEPNILFTDH